MASPPKFADKLRGKHVFITGGSSGIGFALAEASLEHGARVTIVSSSREKVEKAVTALKTTYSVTSQSDNVRGLVVDLADEETLDANIQRVLREAGPFDHLVHLAGDQLYIRNIHEYDLAFIRKAGMTRFFAPLLLSKYAAERNMPRTNEASITFTGAGVSVKPRPDWTMIGAYETGKFGMVRGLAIDLKPIRVNLVSPGLVATEFWSSMAEVDRNAFYERAAAMAPTGNVATADMIAEAYLYMMRDWNMTGRDIRTDSGMSLL